MKSQPFIDNCQLGDDGSLDTIIIHWRQTKPGHHKEPVEYRYSDTSEYRDNDGLLDFDRFIAEVVKPDYDAGYHTA